MSAPVGTSQIDAAGRLAHPPIRPRNLWIFPSERLAHFWPLLGLAAVPLWIWGLVTSQLVISDLGIVNSFPLVFWVAIGLMVLSYVGLALSKRLRPGYLLLLFCMLVVSLWLLPHLLGASQMVAAHTWGKTGVNTTSLLGTGHLNPGPVWYHSYPGVWIILVSVQQVAGISGLPGELAVHPFSQLAIQVIFAPIAYILLSTLWSGYGRRWVWLSLLVFLSANWFPHNYPSPQAYGLALLLLIIWAMVRQPRGLLPHGGSLYLGVVVILVTGIVLSHLPSAIMLLSFLVMLYFGFLLLNQRMPPPLTLLVPIVICILVTWNLHWAGQWFGNRLPGTLAVVLAVTKFFQISVIDRVSGDFPQATVAWFRLFHSVSWTVIGLTGVGVALLHKQDRPHWVILLTLAAVAVGAGTVTLGLGAVGSEIVQRAQLILTSPIAFFAVFLARHVVTLPVLIAILLASPYAVLVAHFGNQRADYLTPDYTASVEFFHTHASPGSITTRNEKQNPFGKLAPPGIYRRHSAEDVVRLFNGEPGEIFNAGDYVVLTQADYNDTRFSGRHLEVYDKLSYNVLEGNMYNCVYVSPTVGIYTKLM
jgi:hypothetical protein